MSSATLPGWVVPSLVAQPPADGQPSGRRASNAAHTPSAATVGAAGAAGAAPAPGGNIEQGDLATAGEALAVKLKADYKRAEKAHAEDTHNQQLWETYLEARERYEAVHLEVREALKEQNELASIRVRTMDG